GHHVFNYVDKPDYDMNRLVAAINAALGRSSTGGLRLPYALGYAAGLAADVVAAIVRRPLPFSRIRVQKFCASTEFSSDKAMGSGFKPPVDLDDALQRTISHEFGQDAGSSAA
nr:UDP-N-acetylglucosamine 4-epimerase [Myxococcota bacterium]